MKQFNPPHPGNLIKHELMPHLKLPESEVAKRLHVSAGAFNRFLNEKAELSTEMALKIEAGLGVRAELLLGMQQAYNLFHASQNTDLTKGIERLSSAAA